MDPSNEKDSDKLVKSVLALQETNKKLIDGLKRRAQATATHGSPANEVPVCLLSPVFSSEEAPYVSLLPMRSKSTGKSIVSQWRPAPNVVFKSTTEMNLFNDNINYSVRGFDDLQRLNTELTKNATKFGWLDSAKSPPILRHFIKNLKTVKTLLDDVEDKFVIHEDEIKRLMATGDTLAQQVHAWKQSVREWNIKNAPDHVDRTQTQHITQTTPKLNHIGLFLTGLVLGLLSGGYFVQFFTVCWSRYAIQLISSLVAKFQSVAG